MMEIIENIIKTAENEKKKANQKQNNQAEQEQGKSEGNTKDNHEQVPGNEKKSSKLDEVMEEHGTELKETINQEVEKDSQNKSYISQDELDGIFGNHFEEVRKLIDNKLNKNDSVDLNVLKEDLKKLIEQVKNTIKEKVNNLQKTSSDSITKVKNSAKDKVNESVNHLNDKVKGVAEKVDKKIGNEVQQNKEKFELYSVNEKLMNTNYAKNIKDTLTNNPDLYKDAMLAYNIHSMSQHIENSKNKIEELNSIKEKSPDKESTINELKMKLNNSISQTENNLNEIQQQVSSKKTIENIHDNATDRNQKNNDKGHDKEQNKDAKETVVEEEIEISR